MSLKAERLTLIDEKLNKHWQYFEFLKNSKNNLSNLKLNKKYQSPDPSRVLQ